MKSFKFSVSSFKWALLISAFCILHSAFSQTVLTADGLAAFKKKAASGGGGGSQFIPGAHATANAASTSTATTTAMDSSGANLIVIAASYYQPGTGPTVSDSKGNTWTALTAFHSSGGTEYSRLYYCINPTVGTGHTFSLTATYSVINVACYSVSGRTPVFDSQNGFNRTEGATITSFQIGSVSPSAANSLVVGIATWDNSGRTITGIDSGMTITDQHQQGANTLSGAQAYVAQTTAITVDPTVTLSGSVNACSGAIAVFK